MRLGRPKRIICKTRGCGRKFIPTNANHVFCNRCALERRREHLREWRKKHPRRQRELREKWKAKNKERIRDYNREYMRERRQNPKVRKAELEAARKRYKRKKLLESLEEASKEGK